MTPKKLSKVGGTVPAQPSAEPDATFVPHEEAGGATTEYTALADGPAGDPPPLPRRARPAPAKKPARKVSRLGDFQLLRELGRGGMGVVYKARQISRPRLAAVKVLGRSKAAQPAFLERFHREARLMARLDHPHLLRCYDVGEDQGWHYLAVELLEGGSLEDWLGRLAVGDAVHVALACARGLAHAHDLNLVHRDVKPANILLAPDGTVKLADLGLAKEADDDLSLTRTGTGAGTPLYMAPEQAVDAKRVDARGDVYALGGTLYHLLTGRPPFEAGNFLALLRAKQKGLFVPARRLNPDVPERLDAVLGRMLARHPEQRHRDGGELAEDLEWLGLAPPRLSFLPAV